MELSEEVGEVDEDDDFCDFSERAKRHRQRQVQNPKGIDTSVRRCKAPTGA